MSSTKRSGRREEGSEIETGTGRSGVCQTKLSKSFGWLKLTIKMLERAWLGLE